MTILTHLGRGRRKEYKVECKVQQMEENRITALTLENAVGLVLGVVCEVIPTLHLHPSQDTGCGSGCFLRSCMLTSDGTEFSCKTKIAITYQSYSPSSVLWRVKIPQKG